MLGDTEPPEAQTKTIAVISGAMTFSTGIFLTIIRLYEPLFRILTIQIIYQWFGQIYDPKLKDNLSLD